MSIDCALGCGRPLNPHDIGVWKEVTGFVGGPKKDSMVLRTDTGRYAHNACVEKAKAGAAADQQDMFEKPSPSASSSEKRCSACGTTEADCLLQGSFQPCCAHCDQTDYRSHS